MTIKKIGHLITARYFIMTLSLILRRHCEEWSDVAISVLQRVTKGEIASLRSQ
jgi:hypothetical protein